MPASVATAAGAMVLAGVATPSGAAAAEKKPFGDRVVAQAAALKGTPYRYGASGPRSFDCSGYVKYVAKKVGVKLPRTSGSIAAKVKSVSKTSRRPGDIIIFSSGSGVYHVGIYAGGGKMWDAPGSGRAVQKREIWTSSYRVGRLVA